MESEDYTAFEQQLQRPINCLLDPDRNIRKGGLVTLKKQLEKASKQNQMQLFRKTKLCPNLLHTLSDSIQNNRQMALYILDKILKDSKLTKDQVQPVIQSLVGRVNQTPFPEKSEDLRQKVILLIKECFVFQDACIPNITQICNAMAKCLADPSSTIKNNSSKVVDAMSSDFKQIIGKHSTAIAKALAENLKHNKHVVRKAALTTLSKLLITEGAGGNFQHIQVGLKVSLSDAKVDVRRTAYECTAYLLQYMAPKYLKQYQAVLVSYLLTGLNDQSPQNVQLSMQLLQQSGKSILQLYGQQNP